MDDLPSYTTTGWLLPDWIDQHLLPDARFARAYSALADDRRALIKGLIARHYALAQPQAAAMRAVEERYALFARRAFIQPAPFVLLLLDHELHAPGLFLAALMPALCARAEQVLVCHMGKKSDVPDVLLTACDDGSDCAGGRNNPRYAGARNGGRISLADRNPQGATETSLAATLRCNAANPTSEKPKFGKGSAQGELKLRGPASAEINCRPRHNMAYRVGTHKQKK